MKRSTAVTLVLAGSTAIVALYACKPKAAENYPNVQACVDAGKHTQSECETAFTQAAEEHARSAPHFQTREDCIAAYGPDGCEEHPMGGGGSFFMPLMLGYMLGHGMGYHPLYQDPRQHGCMVGPGGSRYGQCSGGGGWFGGGGRGFFGGGSTAPASVGPASGAPAAGGGETTTSARGGFGSAGHGFGGGGE